ncbi:MAG: TraM recognition domain-containing protein, partial [Cyanobacteria bacterium]|nr:TraM recognition domain-containing protein [Cyanobacteriota bacterium]
EETDIDTDDLHQGLFTWYLSVPAHKRELKPLAALFFNFAFELVTSKESTHGLNLFLDELPNFGYVSGLTQRLTILRHDKIPVLIAIQDLAQLELLYGKEWVLFLSQTATKIFFRPNDLRTAETISRALGGAETILPQVTSSGQLSEWRERHQLLAPDELMNLKDGQMVIMTPRTAPCKIQGVHWSACSKYEIEFPPPQREPLVVDETLKMDTSEIIEEMDLETLSVSAHSHLQTEYENEIYGSW